VSFLTRHIIVGFDGSQVAGAALAWAVDDARLHDAELTTWTVLEQQQAAAAGKPVDERDNLRAFAAGGERDHRWCPDRIPVHSWRCRRRAELPPAPAPICWSWGFGIGWHHG
jgi:Universal stress protein family